MPLNSRFLHDGAHKYSCSFAQKVTEKEDNTREGAHRWSSCRMDEFIGICSSGGKVHRWLCMGILKGSRDNGIEDQEGHKSIAKNYKDKFELATGEGLCFKYFWIASLPAENASPSPRPPSWIYRGFIASSVLTEQSHCYVLHFGCWGLRSNTWKIAWTVFACVKFQRNTGDAHRLDTPVNFLALSSLYSVRD